MTGRQRPSWQAVGPAGVAALVVVALTSLAPIAGLLAAVGAALAITGTARGSRRILTIGTALEFCAVVVAGIAALDLGLLLVATVATILSWDLGEQAITAAAQLGGSAAASRPLSVHTAGSTLVGVVVLGGVYGGYLFAAGRQPIVALVLLLAGGGLVLVSLRL